MQTNFTFKSGPLPSNNLIVQNSVFVNFKEFATLKQKTGARDKIYIKIKGRTMELNPTEGIEDGHMAMGKVFRQMLQIGGTSNDLINFEYVFDTQPPKSNLTKAKFLLDLKDRIDQDLHYEEKDIADSLKKFYSHTPINSNHLLYLKYEGYNFCANVERIEINPLGPLDDDDDNNNTSNVVSFGFLSDDTIIEISSMNKNVKIKSKKLKTRNLTKFGFKFDEMGVGGLDKEISDIFRRAFTSRCYPSEYLAKYGIKHVKGILFYGPPGTGKTLMARTLANALNCKEFKVVNGPEFFDKYVGESEKKIRELFKEAKRDQEENGDDAGLHILVFDEIDALCRARGTINSGTGVHDGVVNQLLTEIDGVNSLNDIIVIGMTNRKDMIDEAILRPGRLEIHIEVGLPDEKGRLAIFKIHTKKMKDNNVLDDDVDLEKLAQLTKNYTGADIESLVKLATSNALSQGLNFGSTNVDLTKEHKISMRHFLDGINEIQPMFGINQGELENCLQFGMINYGENYEILSSKISALFTQIKNSTNISLLSVLLEGEAGCGKTALASYLALHSGFPYVKIISPETLVKYMEGGKYSAISSTFEDGYKSPYSIIILDNIEKLIEYIKIGPRFSNLILQTLLVYIKKLPPKKGKKMLIIGTTSSANYIEDLGIIAAFDKVIHVPNLSKSEILGVLNNYDCAEDEKEKIANLVQNSTIRQLCFLIDRALQKGTGKLCYENFASEYREYVFK